MDQAPRGSQGQADHGEASGGGARDDVLELREYLVLAKLAPVVREQVLGMTIVTANELVTEEKLRFIAWERNHVEQRRMYERLLAGQLRCTRAAAATQPASSTKGFITATVEPQPAQQEETAAVAAHG
jgi:hypothetical protein